MTTQQMRPRHQHLRTKISGELVSCRAALRGITVSLRRAQHPATWIKRPAPSMQIPLRARLRSRFQDGAMNTPQPWPTPLCLTTAACVLGNARALPRAPESQLLRLLRHAQPRQAPESRQMQHVHRRRASKRSRATSRPTEHAATALQVEARHPAAPHRQRVQRRRPRLAFAPRREAQASHSRCGCGTRCPTTPLLREPPAPSCGWKHR